MIIMMIIFLGPPEQYNDNINNNEINDNSNHNEINNEINDNNTLKLGLRRDRSHPNRAGNRLPSIFRWDRSHLNRHIGVCKKSTPPEKKTLGHFSLTNTKSESGEQLLPQDGRAEADAKGKAFHRHQYVWHNYIARGMKVSKPFVNVT